MRLARAALAAVVLAVSTPLLAAPCGGFTDVDDANPAHAPFCDSVEWMKNRGITLGLTPTLYGPNSPVTRLQMAAFMYRLGFQNAFLQGGNAFGAPAVGGTTDNHPIELRVNGSRAVRIEPRTSTPNLILGFSGNAASVGVQGATISGGGNSNTPGANVVSGDYGTIGGGAGNQAGDDSGNPQVAPFNTVGGGYGNVAEGGYSVVSGGFYNTATGYRSVVSSGQNNLASGNAAFVGGGVVNKATGPYAAVLGGFDNTAAGQLSVAAGYLASANHDGCIVLADASGGGVTSCFANNEVVLRGLGGFYFWTAGTNDLNYSGARLAPGTGAWAAYSDRDGKQAIDPVDSRAVLEKLVAMPIATWQWKAEPGAVWHMGPTAQDFRAAFGLGDSDKQIVTVDADGVALAAIQGLNAKHEAERATKDAEIAALRAELAAIRSVLATIAVARPTQTVVIGVR